MDRLCKGSITLRITNIFYERLHSFAPYENEKFRAEAVLTDGNDPDAAGADLMGFVQSQIELADDRRSEAAKEMFRQAEERRRKGSGAGSPEDEVDPEDPNYDPFAEE